MALFVFDPSTFAAPARRSLGAALLATLLVACVAPAPPARADAPAPDAGQATGWTAEGFIDPASTNAQGSRVAIDDQGVPIAVWAGRSTNQVPYALRWSAFDGTTWSVAAPVFPPDPNQNQHVRIARAPDGTVWLAWLRFGDFVSGSKTLFSVLMAARRVDGAWSAPETVAVNLPLPNPDDPRREFAILAVGRDEAWVAFARHPLADPFSLERDLYSARRTAGGWGTATLVSDAGLPETRPELVAGPGGRPVVFFGFSSAASVLWARAWSGTAWEQRPVDQASAIAFYDHAAQPDTSGAVRLVTFVREDVAGVEEDHVREWVWDDGGFHAGEILLQAAVAEGGSGEPPDWTGLSLATGACAGCPPGTPPLFRPLWVDFTPGRSPRVLSALRTADGFAGIDVPGTALSPGDAAPNAAYDPALDRWYAVWTGPPSTTGSNRAKFAWTQEFAGELGIGAELSIEGVAIEVVCSGDAADRSFRLYRLEWTAAGSPPLAPPIPAAAVELAISPMAGPCPVLAHDDPPPGRYFYYVQLVAQGLFPADYARTAFALVVPDGPPPGETPPATAFLAPYPQPALGGLVTLPFDLATDADAVALTLHDLRGRAVRRIELGPRAGGSYRSDAAARWDGVDDAGRRLPGGVYFARLWIDGAAAGTPRRVVIAPSGS